MYDFPVNGLPEHIYSFVVGHVFFPMPYGASIWLNIQTTPMCEDVAR